MSRKIVPFKDREHTKARLVAAVGRVIAQHGFVRLGINQIAREAGVNKGLIYRYFGGLRELTAAFARTLEFWPDVKELLHEEGDYLRHLSSGKLMGEFFRRYFRALMKRPVTLEILAWEALEKNELTEELEKTRIRTALEFFEYMEQDPPDDVDISAVVALMAGAVNFLSVRSRRSSSFGGIDLQAEAGLRRIEGAMCLMLERTLDTTNERA